MKETWELGGFLVETVYDGEITTTTITGDISGTHIIAKAHAKWFPDDHYSEAVGKKISFFRALHRYSRKAEKALVRDLVHA